MLTRAKLGRATAKLPRKHAGEVVAIRKAMLHGHLIDGFVRECERLPREPKTRGQNISGRRVPHVLAKYPDEAVQSHARSLCQKGIR